MQNLVTTSLAEELQGSYLEYAMVSLSRALPDFYDGLKTVQRRILYSMKEMGLKSSGSFVKVSRVSGHVSGFYHPHGSSGDSITHLGQTFKFSHPLVNIHGNSGHWSIKHASERYLETKLNPISEVALLDNLSVCRTRPTYDGSSTEPVQLSAKLPFLLLSGSSGISTGYACNFPQHSLKGIVSALGDIALGKEPKFEDLIPDFPGNCNLIRDDGLKEYIETGRGSIRMQATVSEGEVERSGRKQNYVSLTYTDLPYGVSTEKVGEQLRKALENGKMSSPLKEIVDLSDRSGDCLQLNFSGGADLSIAKAEVFGVTDLDTKFSANSTAMYDGKPEVKSPAEFLRAWFARRMEYFLCELALSRRVVSDRLHILQGYHKSLLDIDEVVRLIKASKNRKQAAGNLKKFGLTPPQSEAVLDLKLSRLTNLETGEIEKEMIAKLSELKKLKSLIRDKDKRNKALRSELRSFSANFGHERLSTVLSEPKIQPMSQKKPTSQKRAAPRKTLRYVKLDRERGIVSQLPAGKGRSADLILDSSSKISVITESGMIYKLPANFKGPISNSPERVLLFEDFSKLSPAYLMILRKGNEYKYLRVSSRCFSTTSSGAPLVKQGYKILIVRNGSIEVKPSPDSRAKVVTLNPEDSVKAGKGSSGNKLFHSDSKVVIS